MGALGDVVVRALGGDLASPSAAAAGHTGGRRPFVDWSAFRFSPSGEFGPSAPATCQTQFHPIRQVCLVANCILGKMQLSTRLES